MGLRDCIILTVYWIGDLVSPFTTVVAAFFGWPLRFTCNFFFFFYESVKSLTLCDRRLETVDLDVGILSSV